MPSPTTLAPAVDAPRSVKTGKPNLFESQTCGRCGGSGHYSYNSMDGTRCYGCGGHGIKLTKRGVAAQARFTELLSKPAADLVAGDKIRDDGVPGFSAAGWRTVIEVVPSTHLYKRSSDGPMCPWRSMGHEGRLDVRCEGFTVSGEPPDSLYRVAATAEEKAAAKAKALEYQASLTKSGQPRKR